MVVVVKKRGEKKRTAEELPNLIEGDLKVKIKSTVQELYLHPEEVLKKLRFNGRQVRVISQRLQQIPIHKIEEDLRNKINFVLFCTWRVREAELQAIIMRELRRIVYFRAIQLKYDPQKYEKYTKLERVEVLFCDYRPVIDKVANSESEEEFLEERLRGIIKYYIFEEIKEEFRAYLRSRLRAALEKRQKMQNGEKVALRSKAIYEVSKGNLEAMNEAKKELRIIIRQKIRRFFANKRAFARTHKIRDSAAIRINKLDERELYKRMFEIMFKRMMYGRITNSKKLNQYLIIALRRAVLEIKGQYKPSNEALLDYYLEYKQGEVSERTRKKALERARIIGERICRDYRNKHPELTEKEIELLLECGIIIGFEKIEQNAEKKSSPVWRSMHDAIRSTFSSYLNRDKQGSHPRVLEAVKILNKKGKEVPEKFKEEAKKELERRYNAIVEAFFADPQEFARKYRRKLKSIPNEEEIRERYEIKLEEFLNNLTEDKWYPKFRRLVTWCIFNYR